ncbi:MAG TPA: NRDE family protein [Steroidobacteraceae bacterium]
MCLLVFAWNVHPRYRLIFAGNRDEFHDRPAAALAWWEDHAGILGGRDLQASGTWLAVSRRGRFGVVTNYRDLQRPEPGAPSRGLLITRYLAGEPDSLQFTDQLTPEAGRFGGFNLLLADERSMAYASNRAPEVGRELAPGVYGLSNHLLDTPWPKLTLTRQRFERLIALDEPQLDGLFEMLGDRTPVADHLLPSTGVSQEWERLLSSPFIVNERYGTRCSTVVRIDYERHVAVQEHCFDRDGRILSTSSFEFEAL